MTITFTDHTKEVSFVIEDKVNKKEANLYIKNALHALPTSTMVIFWEEKKMTPIDLLTIDNFMKVVNI